MLLSAFFSSFSKKVQLTRSYPFSFRISLARFLIGGNKNKLKNTKRNIKQRSAYANKMVHPEEFESP